MDAYGVSIIAVVETLVHVRIILLLPWERALLFLSAWSHIGFSQRHGPPEVVIPLRVTGTGVGMNPSGWLSYSLHFGGQRHIVHMKVKKLFLSRNLPVFTYTDQGALLEDQPFVQNDCYYHGYVEGDPESMVGLSTCFGGFQGIIQTKDIAYEIEPKRLSTLFEHLVYMLDSEETQSPPMTCGLTDEEIAQQLKFQESDNFTLMQSSYEGWWTHRRYLELAVIVDHNHYVHRGSNITKVQVEVCTIMHHVSYYLKSLDVDAILSGIEIWTERNLVAMENIVVSLKKFCDWKRRVFNIRVHHDMAQVFVRKVFGTYFGLSHVGTVCTSHHNCGIESFMTENLHSFAHTVSHELGHSMGMTHDDNTCKCGLSKCIMFPGRRGLTPRFSNCSYAQFWNLMVKTNCMRNPPKPEHIFKMTRCGNSVVEEGEECDCGSLELCTKDLCCQSNCTLSPGADCAFGLCCKDCKFMPSGQVCREKKNECDLPEWCNGTSYQCPEDVYMQDGFSCMGGGYCYEKRCNNRHEQCRKIFGKEARSANPSCYRMMNTRGDRFGHCGLRDTTYVRCNISDILCGRVQCEKVAQIPLLRDHSTVHWVHLNGVTCWGTDYHFGMTIPDIGEVKDGTECGTEHICIQRKCVPMSRLDSNCSPETCNMNGVCNNRHHCHCNYDWNPPDCLENGTGGSIDSGPPPPQRKEKKMVRRKSYLTLYLLIPLIVLLSCLLIWLCMRRKKNDKKEEQNVPTQKEDTSQQNILSSPQKEKQNV